MIPTWMNQFMQAAPVEPMVLVFTTPANLLYPADVTNAPVWFNYSQSFYFEEVLLEWAIDHWIILQGSFDATEGSGTIDQLGNSYSAEYSGITL